MVEFGVCHSLPTATHSSLLALMMAQLFALMSGKQTSDCHAYYAWL